MRAPDRDTRALDVRGLVIVAVAVAIAACAAPAKPKAEDDAARTLVIPPLPPASSKPAADPPATEPVPAGAAIQYARDPRIAKRRPRSRAIVLGEAQDLERKLGATPASAPEHATILFQLGAIHAELAHSASGPDAVSARREAIRHYSALSSQHPTFAQIDEALYYLGLAREQNTDLQNARRAYYELIVKAPSSKLVPFAYFAFGEMFLAEAASEPSKNDLATQAYLEVLKHAPQAADLAPEALLRLGEIALRTGDPTRARDTFARLRREYPGSNAINEIPPGTDDPGTPPAARHLRRR